MGYHALRTAGDPPGNTTEGYSVDRATAAGILASIPLFAAMSAAELALTRRRGLGYYPSFLDAVASFSSGLWNLAVTGMGLIFGFVSYQWLVDHVRIVELGTPWLALPLALVLLDFASYWFHRAAHASNFLWQTHLVPHSSEALNLPAGLRNGGTPLSFRFLVLTPLALLGLKPQWVLLLSGVHLAGTYWYHTRFLGDLGPLGRVIVTPKQHRVHHAINTVYLDRNFGAWFSVWDRWFGTFQEERPDEPIIYGTTRPVRTYNPLRMDYQHWWRMVTDAARARRMGDRLRVLLGRTNWRPADVATAHPLPELADDDARRAYTPFQPEADLVARWWSGGELVIQTVLTLSFFWGIYQEALSRTEILWFGSVLLLGIVTYTTAMDGRPSLLLELGRVAYVLALGATVAGPDWFGLGRPLAGVPVPAVLAATYGIAVVVDRLAFRAPAPAMTVAAADPVVAPLPEVTARSGPAVAVAAG